MDNLEAKEEILTFVHKLSYTVMPECRILGMKWIKRLAVSVLLAAGLLLSVILLCNYIVVREAKNKVYDRIPEVPFNRVGILLGTSPWLRGGKPNLYFTYRIEAAADLYRNGKIRKILVSGDNRRRNYNEPIEMRRALLAVGVPDSVIVLDYAGIRTFDSMVRAKKVFGQDSVTIISQRFHNERALYIARHSGMEAVGFNARDVDSYSGFRTRIREMLARVKVFIDLLTGQEPRHLGDPVTIS